MQLSWLLLESWRTTKFNIVSLIVNIPLRIAHAKSPGL